MKRRGGQKPDAMNRQDGAISVAPGTNGEALTAPSSTTGCPKNAAFFGHEHHYKHYWPTLPPAGPHTSRSQQGVDATDFADLGGRAAADKVLQRLATSGGLRRI